MLFFPVTDCQLDSPSTLARASNMVLLPYALLLPHMSTAFLSSLTEKIAPDFCLFTSVLERDYSGLLWIWPQRLNGFHIRHLSDQLQDCHWEVQQKENNYHQKQQAEEIYIIPALPDPQLDNFPYQHLKPQQQQIPKD